MGSLVSSLLFQPLLLGAAIVMMATGLYYQERTCGDKDDDKKYHWGIEIFKVNIGIAIAIVITAILINFISAFEL